MKFNIGSLEFMKKSNKLSKDEMFVLGYIIGVQSMTKVTLEGQGMTKLESKNATETIFTNNYILDLWNGISIDLELEVRPLYEIMPEFLN